MFTVHDRVAFLTEANTGFGARARRWVMQRNSSLTAYFSQPLIDLPFPLSISQLHAEQERAAKPVLPQTGFVGPRLPIRDLTRLDAIPPYDPESATATAGQCLRMILTAIERAHVRYVGIVATDTRDVVFLNHMIRKECPNVRVFTTGSSIALLQPDDAYHLRGMVVGSTYPLAPITQYWARTSAGPSRVTPFPTEASQGYYNAVLAHHRAYGQMLGYHPPRVRDDATLDRPPIWISVVGHSGRLVPVHCYTEYDESDANEESPKVFRTSPPEKFVPPLRPKEAKAVAEPAIKPVVGVPLSILLGSLAAVAALATVILALTVPHVWQVVAAGLKPSVSKFLKEVLENPEKEKDHKVRVEDSKQVWTWVWVWRGVMLAGVLLFVLPFTIPALEWPNRCCGLPSDQPSLGPVHSLDWRHLFVYGMALVLVGELLAVLVLLLVRVCHPSEPGTGPTMTGYPKVSGRWYGALTFLVVEAVVLVGELLAVPVLLLVRARRSSEPGTDQSMTVYPDVNRRGYGALAILVVVAVLGTCCWWWALRRPAERFFLYVRAADLTAGLSPVFPMGLLGVTTVALGWFSLRQANLARRRRLGCPYPPAWADVQSADHDLRKDLGCPIRPLFQRDNLLITLGLGTLFLLWIAWNVFITPLPSGEGRGWDRVMLLLFWAVAGAVVLTLARFLALWRRLKALLQEILRAPMAGAFERVPHEIGRLLGGYLPSQRPRHRHLAATAWALPLAERGELSNQIDRVIEENKLCLEWVFGTPVAPPDPHEPSEDKEYRRHSGHRWLTRRLEGYAQTFLRELPGEWQAQTVEEAFGDGRQKEKTGKEGPPAPLAAAGPEPRAGLREPSFRENEDYVAAFVVLYLANYFYQLRMLAYAMTTAAPLLLFAAASYSFQPHHPRLVPFLGILLAVAAGTAYVLFGINKDGLISRINRSTPDRITPDVGLITSMMAYVVPLVALAVLQILDLFRVVVEPILGLFE